MKHWTLERFVAWVGGAAVVTLFLGIAAYVGWRLTDSIESSLQNRAHSLASAVARQGVDPVLTEDVLGLVRILDSAVGSDKDVRYAFVSSKDGRILAHTFKEGFPKSLAELIRNSSAATVGFRTAKEPMLDVSVPLMEGQLGKVHVGISEGGALLERRRLLLVLTGILVLTLGIMLYASRWVGHRVSMPLQMLTEAAQNVPAGRTSPGDIPLGGTAELRLLSSAFKEMVTDLRHLKAEQEATGKKMISAERLAALGELSAGLAHEVMNPLDGVIECSRLLEADVEKSELLKKYLPLMRDGLSRIDRVMRQMLTFARHSPQAKLAEWDVGSLVRGPVGLIEERLAKRGISFSWEVNGVCSCICDKEAAEQAILNLVLNAADAVAPVSEPAIKLSAECDDQWVRIHVDDNGPGVPTELREKIFTPFFSTKEPGKGTGLGLAVSLQAVRQCGGDLMLATEPSGLGGARFTVTLQKTWGRSK